jgi:hypothetical protein
LFPEDLPKTYTDHVDPDTSVMNTTVSSNRLLPKSPSTKKRTSRHHSAGSIPPTQPQFKSFTGPISFSGPYAASVFVSKEDNVINAPTVYDHLKTHGVQVKMWDKLTHAGCVLNPSCWKDIAESL